MPTSLGQFISFIAPYKGAFDCLYKLLFNSCNSSGHQRFMQEHFFKNEISENTSQKFHDQ